MTGEKVLTPRIIYKAGFTVVGLVCNSDCSNGTKDALWEELSTRFMEIPQVDPDVGYGVYTGVAAEGHYLAGLSVKLPCVLPDGMVAQNYSAHTYAVFAHCGRMDSMSELVNDIFGGWLPGAHYLPDGDFYFEYYDDRFDPNSKDSVIFLWVPVKVDKDAVGV